VRGPAYARLRLRPWELARLAPGDLRTMLEADEEERSMTREWVAGLIATAITLLIPDPKRLKRRRLDGADLLSKDDRKRSALRHRRAIRAERARAEREGRPAVEGDMETFV